MAVTPPTWRESSHIAVTSVVCPSVDIIFFHSCCTFVAHRAHHSPVLDLAAPRCLDQRASQTTHASLRIQAQAPSEMAPGKPEAVLLTPPVCPTHAGVSVVDTLPSLSPSSRTTQRASLQIGLMVVAAALTGLLLHPSSGRLDKALLCAVDTAWSQASAVADTLVSHNASSRPPLRWRSSLDPLVALLAAVAWHTLCRTRDGSLYV